MITSCLYLCFIETLQSKLLATFAIGFMGLHETCIEELEIGVNSAIVFHLRFAQNKQKHGRDNGDNKHCNSRNLKVKNTPAITTGIKEGHHCRHA